MAMIRAARRGLEGTSGMQSGDGGHCASVACGAGIRGVGRRRRETVAEEGEDFAGEGRGEVGRKVSVCIGPQLAVGGQQEVGVRLDDVRC
jgi:hypothetical protein